MPATTCSTSGVSRVFGGSNCSIGFGAAGPTTPDDHDLIPIPTQDLPGSAGRLCARGDHGLPGGLERRCLRREHRGGSGHEPMRQQLVGTSRTAPVKHITSPPRPLRPASHPDARRHPPRHIASRPARPPPRCRSQYRTAEARTGTTIAGATHRRYV
jgi:hypothetical protein